MYRRILVPLDGSDLAESALPLAQAVAVAMGAELRLSHAVVPLPDYSYKTPQDDLSWEERAADVAADYLEETAGAVEGVKDVSWDVLRGRASDALAEYVEKEDVDLVVLTTHGEGGIRPFWLGSVADELLRKSPVPVLFVRPDEELASIRKVLLPLDGSPEAEAAAEHAGAIAGALGAGLSLIRVMSPGLGITGLRADPAAAERTGLTDDAKEKGLAYLSGVAVDIRERAGTEMEMTLDVVGADQPAAGILDREEDVDLVVMATHGRTGLDRMVLGSVADKILRGGKKPLLTIRGSD